MRLRSEVTESEGTGPVTLALGRGPREGAEQRGEGWQGPPTRLWSQ